VKSTTDSELLRLPEKVKRWANRRVVYFFILPALLALGIVVLLPILYGMGMAFFRFDLLRAGQGNPFVGLEHFFRALHDPLFWNALGNTLVWTFANVLFQLLVGLGLAILLNKKIRFKPIYVAALLVPWATPSAVAALTWRWLLHTDFGVVNAVALTFHLIETPKSWLSTPGWAMVWVIVARVWKEFPFCMIVLIAGLKSIPSMLYDAAKVDGAGKRAQFFYITLPALKSSILVATLLTAIGSFNSFNMIFMMTKGGPVRSTEILSTFIYQTAFEQYQLGLAAAESILMVTILIFMVVYYIKRMESKS
jgi:multiple sugar transport system permease protein